MSTLCVKGERIENMENGYGRCHCLVTAGQYFMLAAICVTDRRLQSVDIGNRMCY